MVITNEVDKNWILTIISMLFDINVRFNCQELQQLFMKSWYGYVLKLKYSALLSDKKALQAHVHHRMIRNEKGLHLDYLILNAGSQGCYSLDSL